MEYRTMRKVYYDLKGRQQEIQSIYESRIHAPSTCVLRFQVDSYPAFFVVGNDLLNLIADIHKTNAQLLLIQQHLPYFAIEQYARSILIDEIGLTNEIENIHSTRREIESSLNELERQGARPMDVRFAGMIEKYRRLLIQAALPLSTCQDVRDLYDQLVLPEVLRENPKNAPDGQIFRSGPVSVRNQHDTVLHEGAYPEKSIIHEMDSALQFLNDEKQNPLIRTAVFHFLFANIHPFYDGNGRMSRFISSYMLARELGPLPALRLSSVIKEDRKNYYRLFRDANDKHNMGDLTGFIHGFLSFVQKGLKDILEFLHQNSVALDKYKRIYQTHPHVPREHSALWILTQNALFSETGLGMQELCACAGKSRATVQKELLLYKDEWQALDFSKDGHRIIYRLNPERLFDYLEIPEEER